MAEKESKYDKSKDKVIFEEGVKDNDRKQQRWLNTQLYSYDGGELKIRIGVRNKNTNRDAPSNKKWVSVPGLKQLTIEEAKRLAITLEKAVAVAKNQ